jgi:hypothetical protein
MRFWTREVAGWLLVGVSLYVFYQCYRFFDGGHPIAGGGLAMVGIFIFRGGIHLLKVAIAAQVCLEDAERLEQLVPARDRVPGRSGSSVDPGLRPRSNR